MVFSLPGTKVQRNEKAWNCRSGEEQSHKSPTPGDGPDEYRRAVKSILIYLENTYDVSTNLER